MTTALAIAALILIAVAWGRTAGHAFGGASPLEKIREYRTATAELRSRKCLKVIPVLVRADQIPPEWRATIAERWRMRLVRSMYAGRHCRPTDPVGIIRYVFPDSTENAAIRVADCESGLYPRAKNRSSSASGLFQLLSFHWAGRFDPFDPYANTRYALRLSRGGTDWGAWVCKP